MGMDSTGGAPQNTGSPQNTTSSQPQGGKGGTSSTSPGLSPLQNQAQQAGGMYNPMILTQGGSDMYHSNGGASNSGNLMGGGVGYGQMPPPGMMPQQGGYNQPQVQLAHSPVSQDNAIANYMASYPQGGGNPALDKAISSGQMPGFSPLQKMGQVGNPQPGQQLAQAGPPQSPQELQQLNAMLFGLPQNAGQMPRPPMQQPGMMPQQGQAPGGKGGQMDPRMMQALQQQQVGMQPFHNATTNNYNAPPAARANAPYGPPGTNGNPAAYGMQPGQTGFGFGNGGARVPDTQPMMAGQQKPMQGLGALLGRMPQAPNLALTSPVLKTQGPQMPLTQQQIQAMQ